MQTLSRCFMSGVRSGVNSRGSASDSSSGYEAVLNQIKREHPIFNTHLILTNFERSAINAIEIVYPFAKQHGCFFQFAQCVWRQVEKFD